VPTYIPGISADGTLAPGLTPAAVRAVLELLSSAEIAATYLPLAGGTISGELFIASGAALYLYDPSAEADVQISVDDGELLVGTSIVLDNNSTLDASKLGVGTVPDARLSANVTLLGNTTTGTGSVVRATSPTLVTPNLGSATCVTINGAFIGASGLNFVCGGNGVIVASDKVFGFSNSTNPQGTRDVTAVRNATGPTLETRAAGGLKVCNADGSAVGPVQCSDITVASGSQIRSSGAQASRLYFTDGFGLGSGFNFAGYNTPNPAFSMYMDASGAWVLRQRSASWIAWTDNGATAGAGSAITSMISQASAGVLQIGTTSNNALGSLNLAMSKFTGYPTSLLPAAASNAGGITYDTTLSKHVGCNGSSWNALW